MPKTDRRTLLKYLATLGSPATDPLYTTVDGRPVGPGEVRISRYEIIPVHVPWNERIREMAIPKLHREKWSMLYSMRTIVKLHTSDGLVGIGDGPSDDSVRRMVGRSAWEFLNSEAIGGTRAAIYDLLGKATGLPACRLLATNPKKRVVQAYWSHCYPPDMIASEAILAASQGYRVHKVKIRPWEDPVAQAHAIFSSVPVDYRVWGDADHTWGSVARTLYYATKLAESPGYFGLESPVASLEEYRQLKGKTPLQLAEHWGVLSPLLVAREGLIDVVISSNRDSVFEQSAFAQMFGVPIWDESNCWSGIGVAMQAHHAAAYPSIEYTVNATVNVEDDLVKEPFTMKDGFYEIPERPGLGVTLDDDAVDKYRVR